MKDSRRDKDTIAGEASEEALRCANPVAYSGIKEGDVVLDLGSGAGLDLVLAARRAGPNGRAIGVDGTDEMIREARRNAEAAGLSNVELRRGIIEELPVENASVDWVISNCAINLSAEKARVFREMARVLRPGGQVVISDVMADELPDWARRNAALYASCIAGAISEEAYVQGLEAAGFSDVHVEARFVYEKDHIASFVDDAAQGTGCGKRLSPDAAANVAEVLAGKVWSARVRARRP